MDFGIIQATKVTYRKKLLRHVLFAMDEANTASDVAKQVTILDAVLWLKSAWEAVTSDTIQKCFIRWGFNTGGSVPKVEDDSENGLWDPEDFSPYSLPR